MRNDEVSTTASVENTRNAGEHDAHNVEKKILPRNNSRDKFVSRAAQVGSFLISTNIRLS